MFHRANAQLPADVHYEADLAKLGFELNDQGQFVSIADAKKFFEYYDTNNERANDVRKEAMHEAAREVMIKELAKLGIKQLYLHATEEGETTVQVTQKKPDGPHIVIFCNDLAQLRKAKNVVVVMGEHYQDAAVLAFRSLMNRGGLDKGSAVGLAKAMGYGATRKDSAQMTEQTAPVTPAGLIILNPGQLLYSPGKNACMSKSTWHAKFKENVLLPEHAVNEAYNIVPGHETPEKHLATFFEGVYNQLCRPSARLFMVGIGDGGDNLVKVLDQMYSEDPANYIGGQLQGLSLVQPAFTHDSVVSSTLKTKLAEIGQSWIIHEAEKGQVVNSPKPMPPIISVTEAATTPTAPIPIGGVAIERQPAVEALPRPKPGNTASESIKRGDVDFLKHSPAGSGTTTPSEPKSPVFAPGRPPGAYDVTRRTQSKDVPFASIESVLENAHLFRKRANTTGSAPPKSRSSSTESSMGNPVGPRSEGVTDPKEHLWLGGRSSAGPSEIGKAIAKERAAMKAAGDVASSTESSASGVESETPAASPSADFVDPSWVVPEPADLPKFDDTPFDHDAVEVLCETRSAGPVSVVELVFPEVMTEVLEYFKGIIAAEESA